MSDVLLCQLPNSHEQLLVGHANDLIRTRATRSWSTVGHASSLEHQSHYTFHRVRGSGGIRYCMRHIFRGGFIFANLGAIREFNNTRKYLPPFPTHECDLYTCTQY